MTSPDLEAIPPQDMGASASQTGLGSPEGPEPHAGLRPPGAIPSAWQCVCGNEPCDGLECGVWLPGHAPRKQHVITDPASYSAARRRAWETRRLKYGPQGHS